MKLLQIAALLSFCTGCLAEETATSTQIQTARSNIVAAMPNGWSVIPPSSQQQRITAAYFNHPETKAFLLLGTAPNYIDWTDKQGDRHQEYLAKECLYIWIAPSDFIPPFPHWWQDHERLPDRVCSSGKIRVYGYVSHHISDTNRMDAILKAATRISSPDIHLSWTTWRGDIAARLKK